MLKSQFLKTARVGGVLKFVTISHLLLLLSASAFSQNKPAYSLLWRISGHGLKKPSYLFGTMHVKDKRAFGFSDSVMLALQKCDAFALEIHPDTLLKAMYETMDKSDSGKIQDMLTDEQYSALSKRFEEKNGYEMEEVNPLLVENLIAKDRSKPDDKATFLDAYLFGIAKTLHKNLFGLEKAADQLKTFTDNENLKDRIASYLDNEDTEEEDEQLDELTKLYGDGDLKLLYNYLNHNDAFNAELANRNTVMLNSMMRFMANRSLFTAVGVAHLPGDDGLIALLRAQGFTVTAVNAPFTGVSDKFKVDPSQFAWTSYSDKEQGFSLEMPGVPIIKNGDVKTVIYPDIINDVFYGAYAIPMAAAVNNNNIREVLKNAVAVYKTSKNIQISNEKDITVNGLPGIIFDYKSGANTWQMQFVMQNSKLYGLYTNNKTQAQQRFYNSLRIFKIEEKPASPWIAYKSSQGAFSIAIPAEPQILDKEVPNPTIKDGDPYSLHIYVAADKKNMMNYLIRYNDLPAGMYIKDKQASFEGIENSLKGMGTVIGKPVIIHKDGFEGRYIKINAKGFYADVQMYMRGNRQYMLLRQSVDSKVSAPVKDNFFSSFKFTDYEAAPAYTYKAHDESFSLDMPAAPKIVKDSTESNDYVGHTVVSISTNPASGAVYFAESSKLSPYFKAANVDSVYSKVINDLVTYQDSLLKVDTVLYTGGKGREFITQNKYTKDKKRHRLYIDNASTVYLTGYMNSDEYFSAASDRFFTSYKKLKNAPAFDLAGSKSQMILKNLQSTDTTAFQQARGALNYYNFDVKELPVVYTALKSAYPDDSLNRGTRHRLLNILTNIHDDATISELKDLYQASTTNDDLRINILKNLPYIDKKKGYEVYLNLLTKGPYIKAVDNYDAFSPLADSLEYTAANFQQLLPLLERPSYRFRVASLANDLLNDKDHPQYNQLVKGNYKALTTYASQDLTRYLTDTTVSAYNTGVYYYLQLMKKLPGDVAADKFTATLIKREHKETLLLDAARTRIANHLPIEQRIVNGLLDSLYSRFEIMEAYSKVNQLSKVPAKYRTPAEFGRVCMYNYVGDNSENENYTQTISLLGTVLYKGSTYYAYQFTDPDDDDQKKQIGIYKPAKTAPGKLGFEKYNCYSAWETKKVNWQLQAQKLIAEWIKSENK